MNPKANRLNIYFVIGIMLLFMVWVATLFYFWDGLAVHISVIAMPVTLAILVFKTAWGQFQIAVMRKHPLFIWKSGAIGIVLDKKPIGNHSTEFLIATYPRYAVKSSTQVYSGKLKGIMMGIVNQREVLMECRNDQVHCVDAKYRDCEEEVYFCDLDMNHQLLPDETLEIKTKLEEKNVLISQLANEVGKLQTLLSSRRAAHMSTISDLIPYVERVSTILQHPHDVEEKLRRREDANEPK